MPSMEPRVVRRWENCSATDIMAVVGEVSWVGGRGKGERVPKKLECVAMYVLSSI